MSYVAMASASQVLLAPLQALAADDGRQLWEHELPADWKSASIDPTPDRSAAGGDEAGVAVTGIAAGCVLCILRKAVSMAGNLSDDAAVYQRMRLYPLARGVHDAQPQCGVARTVFAPVHHECARCSKSPSLGRRRHTHQLA